MDSIPRLRTLVLVVLSLAACSVLALLRPRRQQVATDGGRSVNRTALREPLMAQSVEFPWQDCDTDRADHAVEEHITRPRPEQTAGR